MTKINEKVEKNIVINDKIPFSQVQLISNTGENLGIVKKEEALRLASSQNLDLVLIAERGGEGHPVAKIIDFGKMSYEKKKQQSEARKKQHVVEIKEIQIRPKIAEHDYQTKLNQAVQFLKNGKRLKLTLVFGRGREMMTKEERGTELFAKVQQTLIDAGILDQVVMESDNHTGQYWSRIYYLKK